MIKLFTIVAIPLIATASSIDLSSSINYNQLLLREQGWVNWYESNGNFTSPSNNPDFTPEKTNLLIRNWRTIGLEDSNQHQSWNQYISHVPSIKFDSKSYFSINLDDESKAILQGSQLDIPQDQLTSNPESSYKINLEYQTKLMNIRAKARLVFWYSGPSIYYRVERAIFARGSKQNIFVMNYFNNPWFAKNSQ